ncbi:MAG: SdpI family protein [Thermoplasmatales archaeon]|jgi:uncharacterized membrane protein|nr:SdpI family protein [Thermoplasmatales archaeon]
MDDSLLITLIFIIAGTLEIIQAIPLIQEKIKRNKLYGFRTPKTLSSDEIWYKANKYVGKDFVFSGIILVVGSLFLLLFKESISIEEIVWIELILVFLPLAILLIKGFNYLKSL